MLICPKGFYTYRIVSENTWESYIDGPHHRINHGPEKTVNLSCGRLRRNMNDVRRTVIHLIAFVVASSEITYRS